MADRAKPDRRGARASERKPAPAEKHPPEKKKPAPGHGPKVRVRMYRQGLGDCFLITFGAGDDARHMLIDCGTLGASTTPDNKMAKVVAHIAGAVKEGGGDARLTVLVATHEHKDHLSGFNSEPEVFKAMRPRHVWLAWTENPRDKVAKQIKVYKDDLALALGTALRTVDTNAVRPDGRPTRAAVAALAARDVLGFAGDPQALGADKFAETIDAAMKFVRDELGVQPTYHTPGEAPIELADIPGFRFYVLGPPRDRAVLGDLGEHGSSHLYGLRAAALILEATRPGAKPLAEDVKERCEQEMPFDVHHRVTSDEQARQLLPRYYDRDEKWRQVDEDWLNAASDLALQLDSLTNNTSLAMAIERVADGRVLLFPADAQQGNWLSWHAPEMKWTVTDGRGVKRQVTAADLLGRTVFYKTGHHCSHNATAKGEGLELMDRENELTAFIPVDRKVALSRNPKDSWQMPARPLYRRLLERCQGRVARSDLGWAGPAAKNDDVESEFRGMASEKEWEAWQKSQDAAEKAGRVTVEDLYVQYTLD